MKRIYLTFNITVLIGVLLGFQVGAQAFQGIREISSYGTIDYSVLSLPLSVNGSKIIDRLGQEVVLRGFNIWGNDWKYGFLDRDPYAEQWVKDKWMPLSLAHMQQVKNWGFNVIRIPVYWTGDFEADEMDVENYDKFGEGYSLMPLLKTLIRMADSAGLYVIPAVRICYDPYEMPHWAGWSTHDYVVYNQVDSAGMHGLTRFTNFLEWFVSELEAEPNIIGYTPWMYPYHRQNVPETDERIGLYNIVVTPAMFSAIRKHSHKIIFWSPIHIGGALVDGRWQETGRYRIGVPSAFNDGNVVYGIAGYGDDGVVSHGGGDAEIWDYDVDYLSSQYDYGRAYQEEYDVPMYCVETGLNIHATGVDERPIRQDRLDFSEALLSIFDDYPKNWIYWEYSGPTASFGVLDGEDPNNPSHESPIVPVLKQHALE